MNYCLATVATREFVPGAVVLFQSFLTNNAWFAGDLIIIHDDLSESHQAQFSKLRLPVTFLRISDSTRELLAKLEIGIPGLSNRLGRFYSIEIFRLAGYDKILFCDSDLLFLDSIEELFSRDAPLIVCGDGPFYRKNCRDAVTFREAACSLKPQLRGTFNAGFMLIGSELVSRQQFERLQSLLNLEFWRLIETEHTDQVLYNILFQEKSTIVGPTYNFLMLHKDDQDLSDGLRYSDAKILHFNGRKKPWMPEQLLGSSDLDDDYKAALRLWNQAYLSYVKSENQPLQ